MEHRLNCCYCQCHLERPAENPPTQPTSRRHWLSPWWFSRQIVIPEWVSVLGRLTKSTLPPLSENLWWQKASRRSHIHPCHWISPQQTFFSFEEWSWSWLVSHYPRTQLQNELGRGHAGYHRRWLRHCLLTVLRALLQVHSDRRWLPRRKLRNKHLSHSNHCLLI
jgi:hypothetical protein